MTGDQLRRIRTAFCEWTQAELAAKLEVTSTTIARWERGERRISKPMEKLILLVTLRRTRKRVKNDPRYKLLVAWTEERKRRLREDLENRMRALSFTHGG